MTPAEIARREAGRQADVAYLRLLNEALAIGRRNRRAILEQEARDEGR